MLNVTGTLRHYEVEGRRCSLYIPQGEGPWPLAVLCGGDLSGELMSIAVEGEPTLLFSASAAWEQDYTPWPAPALLGREPFTGEAPAYLRFLTAQLSRLREDFPICGRAALLGYSLGGLFALWASGQTRRFSLFGSLSGSLWYDGWLDYASSFTPGDARWYLSLGRSEPGRGTERMRDVGECTLRTKALIAERFGEECVTMQWNRGGHFTGVIGRWRKALCWAAGQKNAAVTEEKS